MFGVYRVAAAVPEIRIGNPEFNVNRIIAAFETAGSKGAAVTVFPELALTGYSCGDLFESRLLLDGARQALRRLVAATAGQKGVLIAGLPWRIGSRLFNTAAVIRDGRLLGLCGKKHLPEYREFYEKRQFRSISEYDGTPVFFDGEPVPFGEGLLFDDGEGFLFGVEICEDLWAVKPPSAELALGGATAIFNLSASSELATKAEFRRELVQSHSARLNALYLLAGAGIGESSSDILFGGHSLIAVNGGMQAESARFQMESSLIFADFKPDWMLSQRRSRSSFNDTECGIPLRRIAVGALPEAPDWTHFRIEKHPFVPENRADLDARCAEILDIQSVALARRVRHIHAKRLVIGLSGGLDSTLALLVCARCCDRIGLGRDAICGVTMPGFGTSGRTRNNAVGVAREIGAELREIPIGDAVNKHFRDIGHDPEVRNVVYENSQARERTQILMDLANGMNGLVVGTGDLSEIALGWSTFNGDHMSMYCVNASIPKTLIRFLVEHYAAGAEKKLRDLLLDVNATPVSPELLPGDQHTETLLGSYELHDFYLYYFMKYGETPEMLRKMAGTVFPEVEPDEIERTLKLFFRRFFTQQFKRNAMPDGPKVGTIALSPRGDWRMPADADGSIFQE